jgi:hypothetical protein
LRIVHAVARQNRPEYRRAMFEKLQQRWQQWRADSRQRQLDRALYKAGGGGLPSRQATRGTAYVPDASGAEKTAESVGSTADDDRAS